MRTCKPSHICKSMHSFWHAQAFGIRTCICARALLNLHKDTLSHTHTHTRLHILTHTYEAQHPQLFYLRTLKQENTPTPPKASTKRILLTGPPVKVTKRLPKELWKTHGDPLRLLLNTPKALSGGILGTGNKKT